jgi:hypothetical protein
VDHGGSQPQTKDEIMTPGSVILSVRSINPNRRALPDSFHEAQHRSLLSDDVVAGPFADLLENRDQAVVFKSLRQDITVVVAERKEGSSPLEVSEVRSNADHRAFLLRRQDCSKRFRIRMRYIFQRFPDSGEGSRIALENCAQIPEPISSPLGDAVPRSSQRQTPLQDLPVPPPGCADRPDRRCSGKIRKNSQKAEWKWYQSGETTNEKPFKPKTIFLHAFGGHTDVLFCVAIVTY